MQGSAGLWGAGAAQPSPEGPGGCHRVLTMTTPQRSWRGHVAQMSAAPLDPVPSSLELSVPFCAMDLPAQALLGCHGDDKGQGTRPAQSCWVGGQKPRHSL